MIGLQQAQRVILARILWMIFAAAALIIWMPQRMVVSAPLSATGETYTISGTVRAHDGTPAQNVRVSTGWLDPDIAYTYSDSQGQYSLTVAAPGTYNIGASYFYNQLDPPAQTVTVPPSQQDVDFTFAAHHTIRGVVTGPDGQPVEGATVTTHYTDPLYTSTLTDANGAYTLAVAPGIYRISASIPGLVSPPEQRVTVPPSVEALNFAFFTSYTIEGRVLTYDGQPVSGAVVVTAADDPMFASAMSDVDGSYTLVVRDGTYHVSASFVGIGVSTVQEVVVPDNRTGVDLAMPQPYLIRGTVRDDMGRPVVGAFVNNGSANVTTTAADGSYTLALPPGEHRVNVYSDVQFYNAYDGGSDLLVVTGPPDVNGVDFVLRVRNRTIRGRVVDDQGQPIALADVIATNPLDSSGQVVNTGKDGTYTLTLAAGLYWVRVFKQFSVFDTNPNRYTAFEPSRSRLVDVSADSLQPLDFTLQPFSGMHTIRGQVRDAQGAPVKTMISAMPVDPQNCYLPDYLSTDESGVYTATVKPGNYLVSAYHDRLPSLPGQRVSVPSDTSVDFTYPPLYVISGRVTSESGTPIEYASIRVSSSDSGELYHTGTTESDGFYTVVLAEGTYTVTAFHSAFTSPAAQVVTIPAQSGEINFVLSPAAPPDQLIQGTVLDETGQPAANAMISLAEVQPGGKYVRHDGTFAMAVYPGSYTVWAGGAVYASSAPQQITVPPAKNDLVFTVRRADHYIFGQVVDKAGNPLCWVNIEASGEGMSAAARTNNSGLFALRVPNGAYTIRVSATGYADALREIVASPPDATRLEFVLSQAAEVSESVVYLPAVATP